MHMVSPGCGWDGMHNKEGWVEYSFFFEPTLLLLLKQKHFLKLIFEGKWNLLLLFFGGGGEAPWLAMFSRRGGEWSIFLLPLYSTFGNH